MGHDAEKNNIGISFVLSGLERPVEIAIDRQGIAHIRAETRDDLFFAQGWNAARDRLWQIDLWRKRGLGLLAADFGPGYLEQDRAARLFLYHGDMEPEWAAYGPDSEAICTAFVAGINARIAQIEAGEAPQPQEFGLLGTRPARWRPEDVVRIRSHCLTRNGLSEVIRAHVVSKGGDRLDALRRKIEPKVSPTHAEDLDISNIPLSVLDTFALATAPVTFSHERLAATLAEAGRWRKVTPLGDVLRAGDSEGSNNWAISGALTATGRPIMASDPHRAHALPSLRYMVHLTMPGLDVIGMGEPSVPGISLGHNEHFAYSLTIFGGDQEDVYVYETDPAAPNRYRYGAGWEEMREQVEHFEVRGHEPIALTLRYTQHGPVIAEEPGSGRAYALRTVWSEPGMAPYMASLKVMQARDYAGYVKALENWGTPSVNHVFAGIDGTIAWHPSGAVPIRPNWNGLLPVPGDGRYEWAGFLAPGEQPVEVNPECGFIATANEMNLPEGWQETGAAIGFEWLDRSRSDRIHAVLGESKGHDLDGSCRLQNDVHSEIAKRICTVLAELPAMEGEAEKARVLLSGWNGWASVDSAQAALFEFWLTRYLKPQLGKAFGADEAVHSLLMPYDVQSIAEVIEAPQHWFDADPTAQRDALLAGTLAAAWEGLSAQLGPDSAGWKWGDLHALTLVHPLARLFPDQAERLSIPRLPVGGGGSSPNYAPYRAGDFGIITGPSLRLVMDVGAWDNSRFVTLPGQSGDPASLHFRDMAEDWRRGAYHPLRFSRDAIDEGTEAVLRLFPAR
ncbi:penicillin acylase family protein [Microvirga sp. 17 mud 1-3]|uniref:penicillin acylase family protein n=1 Tax=Microvirga sp. 17 mud 1-3 TaxID=2082949 RepID=UPI000D6C7CF7|nr:penicillin acylase family protein [Microvirga sp. 17 mud 1-3]AWM88431.1 penicillin acylase family protein [Microvirga sp. 17 mud 1-3]